MTVFETERLRARAWTPDDAAAAFDIYRDHDVVRFLGSVPQPVDDMDEMRRRVERWIGINESFAGTGYGMWALETHGGTLVGMSVLKPLPGADEVEVGWHLGKAHWGHGYATEGARAAIERGFTTCGLDAVHAVIDKENAASVAVARRLGMSYRGSTDRFYEKWLEHYVIRAESA